MLNPFVYDRPIAPADMVAREAEAALLHETIENGTNATLAAPRRFGKTSLIGAAFERADRELGMATAAVDCYGVLTREDFAARLATAYRTLPGGFTRRVARLNEEATMGAQVAGTGATLGRKRTPLSVEEPIIELLDLPLKVLKKTGQRTVVAFDEFQSVLDVPGLDGLIRSRIQHHGKAGTYVFAGSEPSLLHSLFVDRGRPLYGQARIMQLGRLPLRAAFSAVADRFEATHREVEPRVLSRLVELGAGHPQRTMLLASALWDATPARGEADDEVWDAALAGTLAWLGTEFEVMWTSWSSTERRVLAALADDLSPLSKDGRRVGLKHASSAQRPVAGLLRRGVLEGRGADLRIVDPMLALWISQLRAK